MSFYRILERLEKHHVEFIVHEHAAVTTIEDAEDKASHLVERLIKTIVFQLKDGGWVLAGVPCHARVDYRKLAAVLGVNRRQLRSMSPEGVTRELGFEIGGVGPFPVQNDVRVVFDESLQYLEMVRCGSGKNTQTLELSFRDLLQVSKGEVHPIIRQ